MHSDRREKGGVAGGGSHVDDSNSSGFTGFSDAQLTRMRRFYNDAQTGSERKPIRGDGVDGDDRRNDGDEIPTSLALNQTPFSLTPTGDMINRGPLSPSVTKLKQHHPPQQPIHHPPSPHTIVPRHSSVINEVSPPSLPFSPPSSELPKTAFFSSSRVPREPANVSPCSSPSLSRPSSTASATFQTTPMGDEMRSMNRDQLTDRHQPTHVKMESIPGAAMNRETDPHLSQSSSPLKIDDNEAQRISPEPTNATDGSKVTAIAVVNPTDHQVNDMTSAPATESEFQTGTKPQSIDDIRRETEEEETLRHQMQSLEVFREQQKRMEEANRMRREMLSAALEAKRRATNAEQQKLQVVQRELLSLDQQLNADVAILRDRIEDASREYHEAQKVYEVAEAEFIRAKMDLNKKTEMKEKLTEHLCVIIQENEMRKAKKLAELMAKLEIDSGEYLDLARSSSVEIR